MSKASYWVIGADGQSYGPADEQMLVQWTQEGRLVAGSLLQDVATNQRLAATQLPALAAVLRRGAGGPAGGGRAGPDDVPRTITDVPRTIAADVRSLRADPAWGSPPATIMSEAAGGFPPATIVGGKSAGGNPAASGGGPRPRPAGQRPADSGPRTIVADAGPRTIIADGPRTIVADAAALGALGALGSGAGRGGPGAAGTGPQTIAFQQTPAGRPPQTMMYEPPAPATMMGPATTVAYPGPAGRRSPDPTPAGATYAPPAMPGHTLESFSVAAAVGLHLVTLGLFSWVFHPLKHGRLPRVRRDDPTGGKAVGLMFVPLFNIWYWNFFANRRLCERVNQQRQIAGLPDAAPEKLALMYAVSMAVPPLWPIGWFLLGPAYFALLQMSVNELVHATRG